MKSSRSNRLEVVKSIFLTLKSLNPPSRFLEQDSCTKMWREMSDERALSKIAQRIRDANRSKVPIKNAKRIPLPCHHAHAPNLAHSPPSVCTQTTHPRYAMQARGDPPSVSFQVPSGRMDGRALPPPHGPLTRLRPAEELIKRMMTLCASLDEDTALRLLINLELSLKSVDSSRRPTLTRTYPLLGPPFLPSSEGGCCTFRVPSHCPTCMGPPVARQANHFQAERNDPEYVRLLILALATHLDTLLVVSRINANVHASLPSHLLKPVEMSLSLKSQQAQPSSHYQQLLGALEVMLESKLAFNRSDLALPLEDLSPAARETMTIYNGEKLIGALAQLLQQTVIEDSTSFRSACKRGAADCSHAPYYA